MIQKTNLKLFGIDIYVNDALSYPMWYLLNKEDTEALLERSDNSENAKCHKCGDKIRAICKPCYEKEGGWL